MNHSRLVTGLVVAGALALGACGGDDNSSPSPGTAAPVVTDAPGTTTGGGGGGGGGGSAADCARLYQQWAAAMGAATAGGNEADLANVFQGLAAVVPADLKDDVTLLSETYGEYLTLIQKYQGDMAKAMQDPQVMAALEALDNDQVQAASDNLSNYFDSACPSG